MKSMITLVILIAVMTSTVLASRLETEFQHPPDVYKPMPLWFINGELTNEGIRQQMKTAREGAGFTGVSPLWVPSSHTRSQ